MHKVIVCNGLGKFFRPATDDFIRKIDHTKLDRPEKWEN
jgi:hypothetical protein